MIRKALVRAYGGEPLVRVVDFIGNGLIYCSVVGASRPVNKNATRSVGFPTSDVYEFDLVVSKKLIRQWHEAGETTPELWQGLKYYNCRVESGDLQ